MTTQPTVYLDHAASTPVRPEAVEAMLPYLTESYGNPSGAHAMARAARDAIDDVRVVMAEALGCRPGEVVFTSGGTEADNTSVFGFADRGAVVCSAIEHHAVLDPVHRLGGRVVGVRPDGAIDFDALASTLDPSVSLVSVMLANNEIGTIQPLADIAEIVRDLAPHAVLHTDAVQAFPWLDVAALASPADLISISAHKFGGPKGVGALVVRDGVALEPRQVGGGQEREHRSGTQNVAGIVAMGVAARLTVEERKAVVDRIEPRRDRLADGLLASIDGTHESGERARKIAGNCHVCFDDVESEALLYLLERAGIMASAASSCASGAQDPSHVLAAIGLPRSLAGGSLRLSLGATTTDEDVDRVLEVLPDAVGAAPTARLVKVLVAMSGGVDSSVAAALLQDAGHDVVGVTMKLWGGESDTGCCSVSDVDDARRVARVLGIEHHVFNFGDRFTADVIGPYVSAHAAGDTPNPCIECNRHVKFDKLLRRARGLGFDAIATGHHARVVQRGERSRRVARGVDTNKDQSYVLYMLGQSELAATLLPVGELTKACVRAIADDLDLPTATKPDSQDVCFITSSRGRGGFLRDRLQFTPGTVLDRAGREMGRVDAVELVTVGQRKGLGLRGGNGVPRYVIDVDIPRAVVTVGGEGDLLEPATTLRDLTWAHTEVSGVVLAQCSAHGPALAATFDPPTATLAWSEPHRQVAPGQSVVLYDGDEVVGGGLAVRRSRARALR